MVPDVSAIPRYDLVFDYDDPINGALPASGLKEMTLKVEWNAAANGTMPIIVQRTACSTRPTRRTSFTST